MDSTSHSLLDQLRRADRAAAWPRFVHLYTPVLLRWAARLGVPPSDRDDLIQIVYATLLRVLPTFDYSRDRSFRAWLYAVVANKWKDARRKKQPVAMAPDGSAFPEPAVPDPAAAIDEAEYRAVLAARMATLIRADFTAATWQAFWATVVDERPAADVAAELGLSANAVYLARSRVLARLRQELAGLMD